MLNRKVESDVKLERNKNKKTDVLKLSIFRILQSQIYFCDKMT